MKHVTSAPTDDPLLFAAPSGEPSQLNIRRLRWIAVLAPIGLAGLLELAVQVLQPTLLSWPGRFVLAGTVVVGMIFLFGAIFSIVERMQASLSRRNKELLALHHASLDIYGELALDTILQKVVDQTRILLDASYGAVSVISEQGEIDRFVTSGIEPELAARIGPPPTGGGVLGLPLHEGQSLRLRDLNQHPRTEGFPEHHPPMKSLLAVPISCKGSFRGNLYLAEKPTGEEFTEEDEATLKRFAQQVAIAIDNADLHRQLQFLTIAEERARIAREMHDGMAQTLAYVNAKAQAVREHLRRNRPDDATEQLEQLAGAAREAYNEVREGILSLRTSPDADESLAAVLRRFVDRWQAQGNLEVELRADDALVLDGTVELQLLRIVQEALSNARKHSGASRVAVDLRADDTLVTVIVADNGHGFDADHTHRTDRPRFGLKIMRERAESVGGTLAIDSRPAAGTRVTVVVPLEPPTMS